MKVPNTFCLKRSLQHTVLQTANVNYHRRAWEDSTGENDQEGCNVIRCFVDTCVLYVATAEDIVLS